MYQGVKPVDALRQQKHPLGPKVAPFVMGKLMAENKHPLLLWKPRPRQNQRGMKQAGEHRAVHFAADPNG